MSVLDNSITAPDGRGWAAGPGHREAERCHGGSPPVGLRVVTAPAIDVSAVFVCGSSPQHAAAREMPGPCRGRQAGRESDEISSAAAGVA